jgi:hypothetical protein
LTLNRKIIEILLLVISPLIYANEDDEDSILLQTYRAKLSEKDHFNSSGQHLKTCPLPTTNSGLKLGK